MKNLFYKFVLPPVLLALIGVFAFGVFRQAKRNYDLHAQISELAQNVEDMEKESEDLRAAIDNFQDPSTIDKEARRRLNLKKEGEEVVVILPSQAEKDRVIEEEAVEEHEKEDSFWGMIMSWFE